ncbi:NADH-ubiquinone oxidoreductase subunit B [Penicillium argentinense]|uniref:NADH-ubiquinone oxidoreductase subunit B n=1 Tax=Penicillium argentinense TaxID=1131581 RepID=A0A9W9EIC4_9EURO|nr:NADH-ubiquinone oxidoreductase subunit B [Penicillium argentinense]KAJ5082368.1 NADH-ubiquinone oxidoreductase subunit B [Penicillium argentinense]
MDVYNASCDEKQPTCTKCADRRDTCHYSASGSWLWTKPTYAGHSSAKYIKAAEYHQSKAINSFTCTSELKAQEQVIGSFAFSSLLISFAFAFPLAVPASTPKSSDPLDEIIQITTLARSMMNFSTPLLTGSKSDEIGQLT